MIEIMNLCKTYCDKRGREELQVLRNVNLTINDGETVAIQGQSGSGKSTLLNILGLLENYESGSCTIDGLELNTLGDKKAAQIRNKKVGFVLQDYSLIESYTVGINVMLPLLFASDKTDDMRHKVKQALRLVGLEESIGRKIRYLSGGQKQRVAIARAIVNQPSVILADEPTAALDKQTATEIMELLTKLNRELGITLIVVTHDDRIADYCSRKVLIENRKLYEITNSRRN